MYVHMYVYIVHMHVITLSSTKTEKVVWPHETNMHVYSNKPLLKPY